MIQLISKRSITCPSFCPYSDSDWGLILTSTNIIYQSLPAHFLAILALLARFLAITIFRIVLTLTKRMGWRNNITGRIRGVPWLPTWPSFAIAALFSENSYLSPGVCLTTLITIYSWTSLKGPIEKIQITPHYRTVWKTKKKPPWSFLLCIFMTCHQNKKWSLYANDQVPRVQKNPTPGRSSLTPSKMDQ